MKIHIEYKNYNSGAIRAIELEKNEYFQEDIAKYGDTIQYVLQRDHELKKSDIEYTLLTITDSDDDKTERVTYFSNESELRYTKDSSGWELIVQQIQVSKNCVVITRMDRDNANSDWKNISYSTILNPSTKNEQLFSSHKGEYIKTTI